MSDEVGIRELRQNLSVYLRRVAEGERFTITEHNRPVASLGPLVNARGETWEEVKRRLKIREPKDPLAIWDLEPIALPPREPGEPTLEQIIDENREDTV